MSSTCLIPPLLVLIVALATRRVILSLGIGLLASSLVAMEFKLKASLYHMCVTIAQTLDVAAVLRGSMSSDSNWMIFSFIISLGVIVVMLQQSGATGAFTQVIERRLKRKKDVEKITLILSSLFFIDDYFSSLSVGQLMSPITDRFHIARAKLAFLVDSMSAPLAILCPFSSWVGVVIGFLANNGVTDDLAKNPSILISPFWAFILLIPFIFYSFIVMGTSWYIVCRRISFGPMREHEEHATQVGHQKKCAAAQSSIGISCQGKASVADFFVIWITLVISLMGSLLYHGGWVLLGGANSLITALHHTEVSKALLCCSGLALGTSSLYFLARGIFTLSSLPRLLLDGTSLMRSAIFILIIAWSMGSILRNDLMIGEYIAANLLGHVSKEIFPLAVFLAAVLTAFATGSSWGTAALFFPMVVPTLIAGSEGGGLLVEDFPLFLPTIGALLSGCVAGDHISPISDTTIMTSVSTGMPHIDHVKTQIPYVLTCIIGTAFSYLLLGLLPAGLSVPMRGVIALSGGFLLVMTSLEVLHKLSRFKPAEKQATPSEVPLS